MHNSNIFVWHETVSIIWFILLQKIVCLTIVWYWHIFCYYMRCSTWPFTCPDHQDSFLDWSNVGGIERQYHNFSKHNIFLVAALFIMPFYANSGCVIYWNTSSKSVLEHKPTCILLHMGDQTLHFHIHIKRYKVLLWFIVSCIATTVTMLVNTHLALKSDPLYV